MAEMTREDLVQMNYLSHLAVNKRGQVVFTVTRAHPRTDRYVSELWILEGPAATPRQLTFHGARSYGATWSPDGRKVAYLSDVGGSGTQVYELDVSSGQSTQLTAFSSGASSVSWSPCTDVLAVVAPVEVHVKTPAVEQVNSGDVPGRGPVHVVRELGYKQPMGLRDGTYSHVLIVRPGPVAVTIGEAENLSIDLGEVDAGRPAWSPDGRYVALAAAVDRQGLAWRRQDVWVAEPGCNALTQVTAFGGTINELAWTPDGTGIVFTGHDGHLRSATNTGVWTVKFAVEQAQPRELTAGIDRPVGAYHILGDCRPPLQTPARDMTVTWNDRDPDRLLFLLSDAGASSVVSLVVSDESRRRVDVVAGNGREVILEFGLLPDHSVVFIAESPTHPAELYRHSPTSGERVCLTGFNDWLVHERQLAVPRRIDVPPDRKGNGPVDAWLLLPPSFDPSRTYPLLLYVHGGPHAAYGWSFFHEFQFLAAQGYAVLYTNPRGSHSYGESVSSAVVGDWGGGDYRDLMRAVDVVSSEAFIDATRMGVLGGSYGGFMTAWIIGHTTRFRAAVAQRALINMMSSYGTSDIGYDFIEFEAQATAGTGWTTQLVHSPIWYVDRVQTPVLITHSASDFRTPVEQAHQFFTALKRLGVETELIIYDGEGHDVYVYGAPSRRLDRLARITEWLARFLHQ